MRYLNAVGGGIVRKIEGKVAYVDEDGFDNPVLVSELVVVLPAGHQKKRALLTSFSTRRRLTPLKTVIRSSLRIRKSPLPALRP